MPSNLSPSREAVERTREDILRCFERMASSDDVRDMLAAAYAIDLAPLVAFIEKVAAHHAYCGDGWYCCPRQEDYITHDDEVMHEDREQRPCRCFAGPARAVLARSAEEPR